MKHPEYNSPAELKEFLEANEMAMQKKFGQNFMINQNAREKIAEALDVKENMSVWEIGPGLGCMTEEFLKRKCSVKVFEIDRGFIKLLHEFFDDYETEGKFEIIEGDVLKNWKKLKDQKPERLAGNLPYNIAATFIADTVRGGLIPEKCVYTVQKEVADRMLAKPGTENYSAFSVICQWAYNLKPVITLAPGNFWPKPNVASTAVLLEKKDNSSAGINPDTLFNLIHRLFSSRRKTVSNNIKPVLKPGHNSEELFKQAGILPNERAENLSVEKFILLTEVFEKNQ